MVGRPASSVFTSAISEALAPDAGEWLGEMVLRNRDGRPVPATVRVVPVPAERQWIILAASHREVHTAEEALAQCDLPVALFDTALQLVCASCGLADVTGLDGGDLPGRHVGDLPVHPEDGVDIEGRLRRVATVGEPESFLARFTGDRSVSQRLWTTTLTALRDHAGRIDHVQLVAVDATEQRQARDRLAVLNEVSATVGTSLDVERTAQEMADVVVRDLADFVTVDLLDHLRGDASDDMSSQLALKRVGQASVLPGAPEATVALGQVAWYSGSSPLSRCLASGLPAIFQTVKATMPDWEASDPAWAESARCFGVHSVMVVPLRARGSTLGVAVMARHRRADPFQDDDLLLADEIAARTGTSIDNAQRYRDAHSTALALQQGLLPQPPPHQEAVDLACRYLPAAVEAGVGGDWFDVIPLPGARVALIMGDVVGHGLHAAVTMGRLRTAVRTLADVDLPPDELLTHLDDLVSRLGATADRATLGEGMVATCLYAVYDATTGDLALASAGQPLPVTAVPGSPAQQMGFPVGPPLGVGGIPFEVTEVHMGHGSLLAMYTDGLVSSRKGPGDRMRRLLDALSQPGASVDATCDSVMRHMPDHLDDDIALLLVRTRTLPAANVATLEIQADPAVVACARLWASRHLEQWSLQDHAFTTELIVSELLTNAIRYATAPIRLRLIRTTSLTCEVWDASNTAPHLRRARIFDEGGRGLMLVAQLAHQWGTRQSSAGKVIWAQITPPATAMASPAGA